MKSYHSIVVIFLGLVVCAGTVAFAQKPGSSAQQKSGPRWAEDFVDEGGIRSYVSIEIDGKEWDWNSTFGDTIANRLGNEGRAKAAQALREKFAQEVKRLKTELLGKGYEPYAATVYASSFYTNEKVIFFRKRLN